MLEWTINVCSCGAQVLETYEYKHTGEGHDGGKPVDVVPKARAAQLVSTIRVLEDVIEFMRDTAHDDERSERGTVALHYINNALKGDEAK